MKTRHKDVLQSEPREAAAGCGECSCRDGGGLDRAEGDNARVETEEACIEQRGKNQGWRKGRQRGNVLEETRVDEEVHRAVGGTKSGLEDNPLSLPARLERGGGGRERTAPCRGRESS